MYLKEGFVWIKMEGKIQDGSGSRASNSITVPQDCVCSKSWMVLGSSARGVRIRLFVIRVESKVRLQCFGVEGRNNRS